MSETNEKRKVGRPVIRSASYKKRQKARLAKIYYERKGSELKAKRIARYHSVEKPRREATK